MNLLNQVQKAPAAIIGEELEVFEDGGKRYFKVKGSDPPVLRRLIVGRNMVIRLGDGRGYTLIGGHPGCMIIIHEETMDPDGWRRPFRGVEASFLEVVTPGVCFKILS